MNRTITFSKKPPTSGEGFIVDCNYNCSDVVGWVALDLRDTISTHKKEWLRAIESWHTHTCLNVLSLESFWHFYPASRLIIWPTYTNFSFTPVLMARALLEIVAKSEKNVWVLNSDKLVRKYFRNMSKSRDINIKCDPAFNIDCFFSLKFTKKITSFFSVGKTFFGILLKFAVKKKKSIKKHKVIVSSQFFSTDIVKHVGDHFFGNIFEGGFVIPDVDVCYIYNDLSFLDTKSREALIERNRNVYDFSDAFSFRILFRSLRQALFTTARMKKIINDNKRDNIRFGFSDCGGFSKDFLSIFCAHYFPISEYFMYNLYKEFLKGIKPKVIIYPYEDKTVEHAILAATDEYETPIRSIGFAHAGYSAGHMYVEGDLARKVPTPKFLAVTGREAEKRFLRGWAGKSHIVDFGSPRYRKRITQGSLIPKKQSRKLRLLFICGLGFELTQFARWLVASPGIAIDNDVFIRPSFHSWRGEQFKAFASLKKRQIPHHKWTGDLDTGIASCDVVLFESTSAAIQAILMGKIAIQIRVSEVIDTEFFDKENNKKLFLQCSCPLDLIKVVGGLKSKSQQELRELQQRQRQKVENVFSPLKKKNISSAVNV